MIKPQTYLHEIDMISRIPHYHQYVLQDRLPFEVNSKVTRENTLVSYTSRQERSSLSFKPYEILWLTLRPFER